MPPKFDPNRPRLRTSARKRNCLECEQLDTNEMVQCDTCDSWYHYECAGVTSAIIDVDWDCKWCGERNETIPRDPENCIAPQLPYSLQPPQPEQVPEDHISVRSVGVGVSAASSTTSSRRSRTARMRELELKKLEEDYRLRKSYLDQRFAIMRTYEGDDSEDESVVEKASQVEEWIQKTDLIGSSNKPSSAPPTTFEQPPSNSQPVEHQGQGQQPAFMQQAGISNNAAAALNQSSIFRESQAPYSRALNSRDLTLEHCPPLLQSTGYNGVPGFQSTNTIKPQTNPQLNRNAVQGYAQRTGHGCVMFQAPIVTSNAPAPAREIPLDQSQQYGNAAQLSDPAVGQRTYPDWSRNQASTSGNRQFIPGLRSTPNPPRYQNQHSNFANNAFGMDWGCRQAPSSLLHTARAIPDQVQQGPSNYTTSTAEGGPNALGVSSGQTNGPDNRQQPGQLNHGANLHEDPLPGEAFLGNPPHYQSDSMENRGDEVVCLLSRSQLAARQAVPKDLPEFSGLPHEWPLFYATYNSSTQMCGFSNEENMLRLRKCLKGRALTQVGSELLHPNSVASVMSTLRMLYGKPETIIQAVIENVRNLPSPRVEKLETLVDFALSVKNLCATIQACEIGDYMYSSSLRYELVQRLPPSLQLEWAKASRGILTPTLFQFNTWLYHMAEDASAVMRAQIGSLRTDSKPRHKKESLLHVHVESDNGEVADAQPGTSTLTTCAVCKGNCPSTAKCSRFVEFSVDARWDTIRELKMCRKCLQQHNTVCKQKKPCGVNGCTYLHHPLLHSNKKADAIGTVASPPAECENSNVNVHQERTSEVLFRFVPVVLYGPAKEVHTYAFIDDGSELTLLEQDLADELGVSGETNPLCLKWTGDTKRIEPKSQKVNLEVSGTSAASKKFSISNARTVDKLKLRPQTLIVDDLKNRFRQLQGLPIESYRDAAPRILIGVDHAKLGHVKKSREGKTKEPIAIKTCLGWCVYGCIATNSSGTSTVNHHALDICQCNQDNGDYLQTAMKEYFSLDSMGILTPERLLMSTDDERSLQLLKKLTRRKGDRYESGLLWKYDGVRLPNSRAMALKRWECLERRMLNDPALGEALNSKIVDYIAKGYIRRLNDAELVIERPRVWYLPVFPVVNPNKPAKTRLVWDAAAKAHDVSLNSVLLKGPDYLTSLLSVLIQFREHRIAVCGDLREMYHQVLMRDEDQHCQRFLWGRKNGTNGTPEPDTYVMQVMTFGACCSPSTAQYVKNQHAKQYENEFPAAVRAIVEQHYVDDMLISIETEEEAATLVHDVKWIHEQGGFEMRNWLSNSKTVLSTLQENPQAEKNFNVSDGLPTEKILGMWWDTQEDHFTFKLSARCDEDLLSGRRRPTKREALRMLMLMYDPCGLIAHFLMYLKVLLQEIWRSGIGWNDKLGDREFDKWLLWVKVLPSVQQAQIPRCYRKLTSVNAEIQLHTFVDASENGFAAAVYLRFQEGPNIECALVAAKTRVAPLRFLSIPRSELQAAVLGVRLANTVQRALNIKVKQRFFHTDSRDVCCWLNSDHRRYSQFVAFRVSEILESSESSEWHWISTKQNVADLGTKWTGLPDLNPNSPWFRGPSFLWKPEEEWPATSRRYGTTDEELRPHLLLHTVALEPLIHPEDYSIWGTLVRRTATIFRTALNWKRRANKNQPVGGPLTREELLDAECYLYRIAQGDGFADEIASLQINAGAEQKRQVPKNSSIYRASPFLDKRKVLRVKGRTGACKYIDVDAINPVILPREHAITKLIVAQFHRRFHHQNHETVVNELRQHYYIPKLKAVYRKVRMECQQCKNERAAPCPPVMADLPDSRLAAFTRPFTHTGVDYFGPISVSIGRRTEKRWGVLATCLTTRAIHLQVAYSLSTDSCIMALRNIFSRRGTPAVIYSDRGTNFQGAAKLLEEAVRKIDQNRLISEFTSSRTEWKFNPPASPHMGGAWERLIRTVKQNLSKVLGSRVVSAEVLENALAEVENIVNSRPLTNVPVNDDLSPVLTPNHFVLQSSNGLKPFTQFDDSARALRNNYELSQILANSFWKQWMRDYLPTITRRSKWFTPAKPIEINDIVIVADPRLPRNCWPKGRIIATKIASDGQVRSATVQTTSGGIYERPAVNLAVLDVGVGGNTLEMNPKRIPGGSVSCANAINAPQSPDSDNFDQIDVVHSHSTTGGLSSTTRTGTID